MAVSNVNSFNQTRDQIITDAYCLVGIYRAGDTISTADINIGANFLNKMVKAWDGKGIHMWSEVEGTLFLRVGVNTYDMYATSSDQAGDNAIETTLAVSASGTSIQVVSATGMSASDNIGIELDNGTRFWTTISGSPSGNTVVLAVTLPGTASAGLTVFSYTNESQKPLHISSARFRDVDGTDRPILLRGRDEFMTIPTKTDTGKVNQLFYNARNTDGLLYVWPTPDSVQDRIKYSYTRMLYDFTASSDNADFPSEWLLTITQNLAVLLAEIHGRDTKNIQALRQEAMQSLLDMQLWDIDNGSVYFGPAWDEDR